jgi:hypothetical protein
MHVIRYSKSFDHIYDIDNCTISVMIYDFEANSCMILDTTIHLKNGFLNIEELGHKKYSWNF